MTTFKDLQGKEWSIRLDAPLVRRIHERLGVKLSDLKADPFLKLAADPELLVNTMFMLCEKQAIAAGISDEEFGERLGDQIDEATTAMEEAVINFSHSSRRSLVRSLLKETRATIEESTETAMKELRASNPEIQEAVAKRTKARLRKILDDFGSESTADDTTATS